MRILEERDVNGGTALKHLCFQYQALDFYTFQVRFEDDPFKGYVIVINLNQLDGTCLFFLFDPDVSPQETIKQWCKEGFIDLSLYTVKYKKLDNRYINDISYIEGEAQKVF